VGEGAGREAAIDTAKAGMQNKPGQGVKMADKGSLTISTYERVLIEKTEKRRALLIFMAEQWHVKSNFLCATVLLSYPNIPVAPEHGFMDFFCFPVVRLWLYN